MPYPEDPLTGPQFAMIALGDLRWAPVRAGCDYWNALRGTRRFPAWSEIAPSRIARLLANAIVIKVLDGGADFAFPIVGDQVIRSYRAAILHRRLSEIALEMPKTCAWWGEVYRTIVRTGEPCAVRFSSGLDGESRFADAETALLPVGPAENEVDRIVGFTHRRMIKL